MTSIHDNRISLIGNLTHDPVLKITHAGKRMTPFSVAVNQSRKRIDGKSQQRVRFIDLVAWDALAEYSAASLKAGELVFIQGKVESHVEEKNGKPQTRREVLAHKVMPLSVPR